jgi:hypothetical protein
MTSTASLIGIGFAVVALLVLVRAMELKDMVRLVKRGLLAIMAFVVLGSVAQMFLPGFLTAGFLACARSSLLLGVAIVVIALALMLIATRRQSGGSGHNKH